jgi:threonine synthase
MKTTQQSYQRLNEILGVEVYLKREDLHAYGSHKGRSIPFMIQHYVKQKEQHNFVISSSGNAALAAIKYTTLHNRNNADTPITLTVYIGEKISPHKKEILELERERDPHISIIQTERPKQSALKMQKEGTAENLRQSTDDTALEGYTELAKELTRIPSLSAIFIPTSSGTTAEALGSECIALGSTSPQIHSIQTEYCHPIAEIFDTDFTHRDSSIAGAIVDNIAHRKDKVVKIIQKSGGSGWIVSDAEIQAAIDLVKDTCEISISPNSALAIAGLQKALRKNWKFDGPVVCLITGM